MAGGRRSPFSVLNVVEVLFNDHWMTANSLPTPCWNTRSTFHEGNFYFTGGYDKREILFICSLESLIASASNDRTTPLTIWRTVTTPTYIANKTEKWIETTIEGNGAGQKYNGVWVASAVLSIGQLLVAIKDGVYKGTLSG